MVDTTKELCIEADASDFTTGAVLSMKCDDGKWHLFFFFFFNINNLYPGVLKTVRCTTKVQ